MNLAVQAELPLELRVAVQDFLWHEAELLDDRRFEDWLALLSEDIRYTAPISVTRKTPNPTVIDDIGYFDDNLPSLTLRVKRLLTDVAWAEDPPSHTRRFVTNIRVRPTETEDELAVRRSGHCLSHELGEIVVSVKMPITRNGTERPRAPSLQLCIDFG